MDTFDEMTLKQSVIVTIHMLEKAIGRDETPFTSLVQMEYSELENMRNKLIPIYNDNLEARRFGAEMIKRGTK